MSNILKPAYIIDLSIDSFGIGSSQPYDHRFANVMIRVGKYITKETPCLEVYLKNDIMECIIQDQGVYDWANGNITTACSKVASLATAVFCREADLNIRERRGCVAYFEAEFESFDLFEDALTSFYENRDFENSSDEYIHDIYTSNGVYIANGDILMDS